MQTHDDRDSGIPKRLLEAFKLTPQMERLEKRAEEMRARGLSKITGGEPGEPVLDERERFGVQIVRRPEDEDCIRISVGEVTDGEGIRYLVFRGDPDRVLSLLERAARAMRAEFG